MAKKVYGVRKGRQPGLYATWAECEQQVKGFPGAEFKSFTSDADARSWLGIDTDEAPRGEGLGRQASESANHPQQETSPAAGPESVQESNGPTDADASVADFLEVDSDGNESLLEMRGAKAKTFIAFLARYGVAAHIVPVNSEHYHRLVLEEGGYVDLYLTKKKPLAPKFSGLTDSDRRQQIKRLWRMFHWQVGDRIHPRTVDGWEVVERYYKLLKPFGRLNFDFLPLAQALEAVAIDAPPAASIRYDFEQIEKTYLKLRPHPGGAGTMR